MCVAAHGAFNCHPPGWAQHSKRENRFARVAVFWVLFGSSRPPVCYRYGCARPQSPQSPARAPVRARPRRCSGGAVSAGCAVSARGGASARARLRPARLRLRPQAGSGSGSGSGGGTARQQPASEKKSSGAQARRLGRLCNPDPYRKRGPVQASATALPMRVHAFHEVQVNLA